MDLVLLLGDKMPDQNVSLQDVAVDYIVSGRDIDDYISHHVDQEAFRFGAELDPRSVDKPFGVHKHDGLGDLTEHKLHLALDLKWHQ